MKTNLRQIKAPIKDELKTFNKVFQESVGSQVLLLNKITHFIIQNRGKQIRPMFVLLSAKLLGGINDETYRAASMIELMHTATLVHDDVVDDSFKRRGLFSINALWKNKIAVLAGDYLLSRSLLMAVDHEEYKQLHNVSSAVKDMSEGELLQMEKARKLNVTEDVYFQIIQAKTASLMKAACKAGALSVTDNEVLIQRMAKLGELIGTSFQIKDDLLDFSGFQTGKPKYADLKEKKMTLPLIYTLQQVSKQQKRSMIRIIKKQTKDADELNELVQIIKKYGGIEYARARMDEYRAEALDILKEFPPSDSKQSFIDLIDYVIERKK